MLSQISRQCKCTIMDNWNLEHRPLVNIYRWVSLKWRASVTQKYLNIGFKGQRKYVQLEVGLLRNWYECIHAFILFNWKQQEYKSRHTNEVALKPRQSNIATGLDGPNSQFNWIMQLQDNITIHYAKYSSKCFLLLMFLS